MSDIEFIDKLNDILINYGYILIIGNNIDYYFKKYNLDINSYYNSYFYQANHDKVFLYDTTNIFIRLIFRSVHEMISGDYSIFYYMDITNIYNKIPIEMKKIMSSLKGTSKEEIILKLQMLGY